ncbi:MAG TPA: DUF4202 domain-containing protein [Cytophagales bacterium]|nr:DUF4202 domain-containing protein [Cytophagales bacterium]
MTSMLLDKAFEKFDAYNGTDPHVLVWNQVSYPQELFLALQLHTWVLKLNSAPSEPLLLASRCQHIGRWEVPRHAYPEGRVGYLSWRRNLAELHALKAKSILQEVGYTPDVISMVEHIILKRNIKKDPDVQTIENALCLVFLEFQYEDFHTRHEGDKVINIIKKSLLKMDTEGREFALTLNYSTAGLTYIKEALKQLQ